MARIKTFTLPKTCAVTENSARGSFLVIDVFQRNRTDLPRETIGPFGFGSNCFSRPFAFRGRSVTAVLRKHITTCDFRWGPDHLHPLLQPPMQESYLNMLTPMAMFKSICTSAQSSWLLQIQVKWLDRLIDIEDNELFS